MLNKIKISVAALALTFGFAAGPVMAQQAGLVNVEIGDITTGNILSENQVNLGAALQLAANVCDVNVNVLAVQFRNGGVARCENTQTQRFAQINR